MQKQNKNAIEIINNIENNYKTAKLLEVMPKARLCKEIVKTLNK